MTKILIVSESLKSTRVLDYTLTSCGFTVVTANSVEQALKLLEEIHFKIALADFSFCHDLFLRHAYPCPVIAMSSPEEEAKVLKKVYQGIDDYILKPFSVSELRMIMNRQLERRQLILKPLIVGEMKIDVARNLLFIKDSIVSLGKHELEIMIRLTKKAGEFVYPDNLITQQRIMALKKKVEDVAGDALQIISIKGAGYKLVAPAR